MIAVFCYKREPWLELNIFVKMFNKSYINTWVLCNFSDRFAVSVLQKAGWMMAKKSKEPIARLVIANALCYVSFMKWRAEMRKKMNFLNIIPWSGTVRSLTTSSGAVRSCYVSLLLLGARVAACIMHSCNSMSHFIQKLRTYQRTAFIFFAWLDKQLLYPCTILTVW